VLVEELLGAVDVPLLEESGVGAAEEWRSCALTDRVADLVADDRGEEATERDDCDVEVSLRRKDAGGEEQRVTGQEEPDQQARLGEDDEKEPDRRPRAERFQEIPGVQAQCHQVHGSTR
jgi:hypothetical protein